MCIRKFELLPNIHTYVYTYVRTYVLQVTGVRQVRNLATDHSFLTEMLICLDCEHVLALCPLSDRLSSTLADLEELSEEHDQLAVRHEQVHNTQCQDGLLVATCGTERTCSAQGNNLPHKSIDRTHSLAAVGRLSRQ